ncbi:hypothetical protein [Desulfosediminicola flagellatus]|uniref:hypothetical protein n=1 Tax=Desulfosediminicola flagellatus TaxID=2569541 RepID=UPI0010ABEE9D|nr:hypothetical protein [Desulfosediminicola flagellatus]
MQAAAPTQLFENTIDTAKECTVREALRWIGGVTTLEENEERITEFLYKASEFIKYRIYMPCVASATVNAHKRVL